jgi:hypothetical protein
MTDLQEAEKQINTVVDFWRDNPGLDGPTLERMLIIFAHIDVLQRYQNVEQKKFNELVNKLVRDGDSVGSAERQADEHFHLANDLRRRIRSATKVGEAIRSQLSYLKTEMNNLPSQ